MDPTISDWTRRKGIGSERASPPSSWLLLLTSDSKLWTAGIVCNNDDMDVGDVERAKLLGRERFILVVAVVVAVVVGEDRMGS